jgi:hypothetical protein
VKESNESGEKPFVTTFNLADRYRAERLSPGAEILGMRQQPFQKLRETVDSKRAVEITRLYFGLPSPEGSDWFRQPFHAADPSFSMVDNKREVAVLAACLLDAGFEDGCTLCALAPLAAAVGGARQPNAAPQLLADLEDRLAASAMRARQREHENPTTINPPEASRLPPDLTQAIGGDWNKVGPLIKQVSDESTEATKALATEAAKVVASLYADVTDLREEVEILWWHIGGWSRLLEMPFSALPTPTAAVLTGLDVADLSRTLLGPAAVPALIQRTLAVGRTGKLGLGSIKEAVDGLGEEGLSKLVPVPVLATVPDVCPVMTAFAKARESGAGTAWHAAFRRSSGLTEETDFQVVDLAMQVFRERQILRSLK